MLQEQEEAVAGLTEQLCLVHYNSKKVLPPWKSRDAVLPFLDHLLGAILHGSWGALASSDLFSLC